ncbi:MAG TPA: HAD-IC family P-type ATPase, partial [Spirochaetota bacterium]|nr:HAD-IC family P-type ATPase [Spirochaetota bacterium]
NYDEDSLLQIAASVEKKSEHPLADAIVQKAEERDIKLSDTHDFEALAGYGILAKYQNKNILIGNLKLLENNNIIIENRDILKEKTGKLEIDGKTIVFIGIDEKLIGFIASKDTLKDSSKEAIKKLKERGIKTYMLTGDNKRTATAIANEIGIDDAISEVMPNEKSDMIKEIMNNGAKVAMVGDGINDSPALACANLGIAIGSGTDVAIESADIVLVRSDLNDVVKALILSKLTIRNVKQNLFWAFCYNVILIPIAAGFLTIFGGPQLNPMLAAAAMSLSSLSVVTNALRLRYIKIKI